MAVSRNHKIISQNYVSCTLYKKPYFRRAKTSNRGNSVKLFSNVRNAEKTARAIRSVVFFPIRRRTDAASETKSKAGFKVMASYIIVYRPTHFRSAVISQQIRNESVSTAIRPAEVPSKPGGITTNTRNNADSDSDFFN